MKNFKKLFAVAASVLMLASTVPTAVLGATTYSNELQDAYTYAFDNGITTQSPIDNANMYGSLTRIAMAKMMANYAVEVLGKTPDTSKDCTYPDVSTALDAQYDNGVTNACQLGLMGVGIDHFNPNGLVTRAEFGTALSRALYGDAHNVTTNPYYAEHLATLKDADIMTKIDTPSQLEVRGYVMLMMQRASDTTNPAICEEAANVISCSLGLSTCPSECVTNVVTNGNLDISMKSSNGGDIPYGISSLPVVTYKFTADEDVRLDSVIIKRQGYFTSSTLESAALFLNGGRISKVATFSSTSDEATLNIANGYEIKAGETVEFTVHVTVANDSNAAGKQFSIKLLSVGSTAKDVNLASNLTSDTFKIVSTASPILTGAISTTPENPKLGQTAADLFNFTLDNQTSNDQDMTLNSITFLANANSTIDEATELSNFKLVVDGSTVATASKMTGKYVIFNLNDGYLIKKGKKPIFTVKADVIGGANKYVSFTLEKAMDVVAMGDKYNQPVNVAGAGFASTPIQVSAGKVTIARTNPVSTDLLRNRKNVFLGALEITNNAGGNLNLQDIKFTFVGSGVLTGILDSVRIKLGSTTASPIDLDSASATDYSSWTTTDLGKAIGSKLMVYVYADTKDISMANKTLRMSWSKSSGFSVKEAADDTAVAAGDISPSSFDFSLMNGKDSDVTLTKVVLGDKTVSKGTEGVDALSLKMKSSTAYGTKIKKMTFTGAGITSDTVTNAVLMNGTTSIPATVNNGTIVVDQDFTVAAGATADLVLKVDVAANPAVSTIVYSLRGVDVDAEDTSADQNTIDLTSATTIVGRTITVTGTGEVVATYESTADTNKYTKNVLGGTTASIAEYSLYSKYEAVTVGKAVVTFNAANTDNSTLDVQVWYNGNMVASNPTWTAGGTVATFDDLNFDTLLTKAPLLVKVVSKVINDDGGATQASNYVTTLDLKTMKGKTSGNELADTQKTDDAKIFGIVPVTLVPTIATVGTTSADIIVTANAGSSETGGIADQATVTAFNVNVEGTNGIMYKLFVKDDAGTTLGSGVATSDGSYTIAVSKLISNGPNTFKVTTSLTGSTAIASYSVNLTGIVYTTTMGGAGVSLDARIGAAKAVLSK
jgi:hypothetical protein